MTLTTLRVRWRWARIRTQERIIEDAFDAWRQSRRFALVFRGQGIRRFINVLERSNDNLYLSPIPTKGKRRSCTTQNQDDEKGEI